MFSLIRKNTLPHKKVPTKLSLKKNIRRSSIVNKKVIPIKNNSSIIIDKSTSSGSLFSSSDSDIFDEQSEKCCDTKINASAVIPESGSDVQFITKQSDNLILKFSNRHDEEGNSHINSTKNESVIFISQTNEEQSLILTHATSIDNSTNSLFSSYGGNSLKVCEDDKQSKSSATQSVVKCSDNNLDVILNNQNEESHENNRINSEGKEEINNDIILVSPTTNDLLEDSLDQRDRNQHIEILDKLYGTEWRKAEKLVFSEPRLTRPLKSKINAPKTDIKPFKSFKNVFPRGNKKTSKSPWRKNLQNFSDSDTSEKEIKTVRTKLFPKVIRKPVKSPWTQRLQNLCDSDSSASEAGKENKYYNKVPNKIKSKLNYDTSSSITSDNSDYESSFVTSTDEPCNSNSFFVTKRKKEKPKRIKKLEERKDSDDEEIEGVKETRKNIFDNKKLEFDTPRVHKIDKPASVIKYIPALNTSEIIHKSFLESLSASVPLNQCDPSARIFRNSYQVYKVQLTERLFKLFNENIFNNVIPADTPVLWNINLTKTAGYCSYNLIKDSGQIKKRVKISLSVKVLDSAERLRCTLVHEMIHAVCMISGTHDQHGPNFKAWAKKAIDVFPELPPIARCHSYEIKAKYTYRCLSCGFCKNRHSKSIDIMEKVCGRCGGNFELLINKTAKGENKSVPVTPKKPSGFALFVKDNYAQCRTPELKHGEVMKLLGSKFNELKLSVGK